MGFAVLLALLLIVGAVVARRRWGRARDLSDVSELSDLDAEADANRWVVRLGGSLSALDVRIRAETSTSAGADVIAAQALTAAAERLRTARDELATARTAAQYALVTRTAVEGLAHVRTARTSLGLDQAEADGLMRIG
ncbi:hypothetical protein GCM10010372_22520 [Streptomyces tauricus]|uniref:hypothetical protein n=1 Tax=Streptomyces TaxID=1883 RepID=UPI00167AF9C9|nr:hypothetical protein [Streptomyces tauricus]GHA22014.1 hypothetical protein GCM10010372_22520 [Streptomyces tauricus]